VRELHSRAQETTYLHSHAFVTELWVGIGCIGDSCKVKFTQVAAAFQPGFPEEVIQGLQRCIGRHFQMHPILRLIASFYEEM
jgi:hypothetical protein